MKTLGYIQVTDSEFNLINQSVSPIEKPFQFRIHGDSPFKAYKRFLKVKALVEKYKGEITVIEDLDLHYIIVEITDPICAQIEKHFENVL